MGKGIDPAFWSVSQKSTPMGCLFRLNYLIFNSLSLIIFFCSPPIVFNHVDLDIQTQFHTISFVSFNSVHLSLLVRR